MEKSAKNNLNPYPYKALAFASIWSAACIIIAGTWAWLNFQQSWWALVILFFLIYILGICMLTYQIKNQRYPTINYKLLYLSALWPLIPATIGLMILIIKYMWWWQQISIHSKDGTFSSFEWLLYTFGIPILMCMLTGSVAPNLFATILHGSSFVKCFRDTPSSPSIENASKTTKTSNHITPVLDAILSKDITLVQATLLDHPEQLNIAYAQNGNTPLHVAALNGYTEIVKLLLAQPGIDKTRKNNDGKTALDLAREKGFDEIAALLGK